MPRLPMPRMLSVAALNERLAMAIAVGLFVGAYGSDQGQGGEARGDQEFHRRHSLADRRALGNPRERPGSGQGFLF